MSPRANFDCGACYEHWEDLPLKSAHCPGCGADATAGFVRLFDAVNVSTTGHRVAQVLDPLVGPAVDAHRAKQDAAAAHEARLEEAQDRAAAFGKAPPSKLGWRSVSPSGLLASIDPAAKADSRSLLTPLLTGRKLVPSWVRR